MEEENQFLNVDNSLLESIKSIVLAARANIYQKVNRELVLTYWQIGKEIVRKIKSLIKKKRRSKGEIVVE